MNTLTLRGTALAASLTTLLTGCSLAPPYARPAMDVPAHWQTEAPWRAAQPADDAPKGPWWQRFNDPQLDRLMEQALHENQSLKVAVSNLEQAQALTRVARAGLLPQVTASTSGARLRTSADRPLSSEAVWKRPSICNTLDRLRVLPCFADSAVNSATTID
ncbi:Outer membrane protein OprM (plasmid) [Ralstonia solanacearum]|nr:TolC family protein [Ralstonia pseudosolanacearum]AOE92270.1 Outer membrane protein OprM [Ralstonia solanacearum]UYR04401.1 TolC family protein [Ralstonia pseudosolanacearum]UYR14354.1 TolC family protein [Ralstonia pseudosolanacearum]